MTKFIRHSPSSLRSLRQFRVPQVALLFVLIPLASSLAHASPEKDAKAFASPDVIVFANGDQLTGKFLRSLGGNAVFHSDVVGDITVKWDQIKAIRSKSSFVVLQKGFHPAYDTLPPNLPEGTLAVENGKIDLTPSQGPPPQPIPLANVEYVIDKTTFERRLLHPPGLLSGWTGNATAGATVVQATQDTYSFTGGFSLVRAVPLVGWLSARNRTSLDLQSTYGKITQPGMPSVKSSIYHADAERDEYFSPRFFALIQAAFDHNFSQGLGLQQIYGAGVGRTFIKQEKQTLDLKATIQYERQDFLSTAPGTNQSLVGSTFAVNYLRQLPKGMAFTQQISYIPAWNNTRAYSMGETNKLILPIYKRLGISLGTIDSYLNNPAVTDPPTKRNSFQFTMGATYSLPPAHE